MDKASGFSAPRPSPLSKSNPLIASDISDSRVKSEDNEELRRQALELIHGSHPGILSTIDEKGYPQSRWMATFSSDDFPLFYTLTSPNSRKVHQISLQPKVTWLFFNRDLSLTVTMRGQARILIDITSLRQIWKKVQDKSLAYFLKNYNEGIGFAVIETTIEGIEWCRPKENQRVELDLKEILGQQ
jgi:general stress protein 26